MQQGSRGLELVTGDMTMTNIQRKTFDFVLNTLFYGVVAVFMANMVITAYGCAAVKPACLVVNLADMACETIAVEYVDPATGKKSVVNVKKSTLTGAVSAAAQRDGVTPTEAK